MSEHQPSLPSNSTPASDVSGAEGESYSFLRDPCCLNFPSPGFDKKGNVPKHSDSEAANDVEIAAPDDSSDPISPERVNEDTEAGFQDQEVSFMAIDDDDDDIFQGLDDKESNRDTVLRHSIKAKEESNEGENSISAESNDDQGKGLALWRQIKKRNLIVLTLVNVLIFIIVVSLIGKHAKKRDRDAVNANTGADAGSVNDNSNTTDATSHSCDKDGATRMDGVLLTPNEFLEIDQFVCSPSQTYMLGITSDLDGDLSLYETESNQMVWSANTTGASRLVLMPNGNLVLQDNDGNVLYSSEVVPVRLMEWEDPTSFRLMLNDDGVLKIVQDIPQEGSGNSTAVTLWFEGSPDVQQFEAREDLTFPVRGTFYHATYDDESSWEGGRFEPSLGFYTSSNPTVMQNHVESMEYGRFDLVISSWMGQDGAGASFGPRMRSLLDETASQRASLKWTFYYELKANSERSTTEDIQKDLEYAKKWFTWDPAWAYMDAKPIMFVNNGDGCDIVEQWMEAAGDNWYTVLRIFDGFEDCEVQPNSWHEQRDPSDTNGKDDVPGYYYSISPGEWQIESEEAEIERLAGNEWCFNVREMVDSGEPWQLVVSFNDPASGTSIESALEWESDSGYGFYLDCLNNNRLM